MPLALQLNLVVKSIAETLGLVRYADDFVIIHHDKSVIMHLMVEL
jgi:hypothetical protein